MEKGLKRTASDEGSPGGKRTKTKKQWQVPNGREDSRRADRSIRPGDSGIWITCFKGKERKSIGEMYDLLEDFAERHLNLPTNEASGPTLDTNGTDSVEDIEQDIKAEVADIKKPSRPKMFEAVWTDIQCVLFFRVKQLIDPVSVVTQLLQEALADPSRKRTRFTQRLTPAPLVGFASEEGLEKVTREVLAPHFHAEPIVPKKYAIRTTIRSHNVLKRDGIIKGIADLVGAPHTVDLTNFDKLILVDVLKNVCSVCVVGPEYEQSKKFNLQEVFDPTPVSASAPASAIAKQNQEVEAIPAIVKQLSDERMEET